MLFGAVPLRECRATSGGGVVLAGQHAHAGSCCDGTVADADVHGCGCAHGSGDAAAERIDDSTECPSRDAPSPDDEHAPCCVDGSASIVVTGAVVALAPQQVRYGVEAIVPPSPDVAEAHVVAEADPDPGDGPPDGVAAVVLLR